MILPDVNVLVYAYRRESAHHGRYTHWLSDVVGGAEELALSEGTLTGFLRIVTNPRIYADPAPAGHSPAFAYALCRAARRRWVSGSDLVWSTFAALVDDDDALRANLLPDAWLAALAKAHGCRLATADRGFARFAGLDWFDPARA